MFMHHSTAFTADDRILIADAETPRSHRGLIAGTQVETESGWRPVETLTRGDKVHTLDGGLRIVARVDRGLYGGIFGRSGVQPIRIAGGTLNACSDLFVMPDQPLLVTHRAVHDVLGLPNALITANALDGHQGCSTERMCKRFEAVTLSFEQEEVIFANSGLLAHCPAATGVGESFFHGLSGAQTEALLDLMAMDMAWSDDLALAA